MLSTGDWTPMAQYEADEAHKPPANNLVFTPDGETLIGTDFAIFGEGQIVFMDDTTLELPS